VTTVGWRKRLWTIPVLCSRCRTPTTWGVTAWRDEGDPPENALCMGCYSWIVHLPPGVTEDVNPAAN
jgi:hypothetical protein